MNSRLTTVLALVVAFTVLAVVSAAAAPSAAPCAPAAVYDPACDANQDGQITVTDIQLTAGHWNQSGTWVSDNDHNHLGQTWTGSDNPLIIQGWFGSPAYAPLRLSNTAGHGVDVSAAGLFGVLVSSAGHAGVFVASTGGDGLVVNDAGNDGVRVSSAGDNGVRVSSAGDNGVYVGSAGGDGFYVHSAFYSGLVVNDAGNDGVLVRYARNWAGRFIGNISVSGNCSGCRQANFALNSGDRALQPGDAVSIQAVTPASFDAATLLWQVTPAQSGQGVVGVVAGRAELVAEQEDVEEGNPPAQPGQHLAPRTGAAQPGEYLTVVYSGPMQVRAATGESAIAAGTRLTAAADGAVRALGTIRVQLAGGEGTADMVESAPIVGVALEEAKDGMVWVLVNPQ